MIILCCVAAGKAFEKELSCENRLPKIDDKYLQGDLGFHMRKGPHYFGRYDWNMIMSFVKRHKGEII